MGIEQECRQSGFGEALPPGDFFERRSVGIGLAPGGHDDMACRTAALRQTLTTETIGGERRLRGGSHQNREAAAVIDKFIICS
jgi:hypothetical protein